MPLYEYQCQRCQKRFERIQKFSDPLVRECPDCGGPVEKLVSAPAFHLKGSGWYATDYKKSGSSSAPSPESAEKAPAKPAASDSKPAADAPSAPSTANPPSKTE